MLTAAEWLLLKSLVGVCFAQAAVGIGALWRMTNRAAVDHYRLGEIEKQLQAIAANVTLILANHLPHLQNTLNDINTRVTEIETELKIEGKKKKHDER